MKVIRLIEKMKRVDLSHSKKNIPNIKIKSMFYSYSVQLLEMMYILVCLISEKRFSVQIFKFFSEFLSGIPFSY